MSGPTPTADRFFLPILANVASVVISLVDSPHYYYAGRARSLFCWLWRLKARLLLLLATGLVMVGPTPFTKRGTKASNIFGACSRFVWGSALSCWASRVDDILGRAFLAVDTLFLALLPALFFSPVLLSHSWSLRSQSMPLVISFKMKIVSVLRSPRRRLLFSRHVLVSVEMSLLEIIFSFVPAAILIVGGFWLLLPSVALTLVASVSGMSYLILVGVYTTLAAYVLLVALVGAIFNAWITSSWMFLFMKMHREGVASRVMHYLARVFRR